MVYLMTTTFTDQKPAVAAKSCRCGRIHAFGDVVAIGRFMPGGPTGYRAAHTLMLIRATREEAMLDVCQEWTE